VRADVIFRNGVFLTGDEGRPQASRLAVFAGRVLGLDERGEPTGLLQEQAQTLVRNLVCPYSGGDLAQAIGRAHARYLAEGITSVCDAGIGGGWVGHSGAELAAYQLARETGRLAVRTTVMAAAEVLHPVAAHPGDGITVGFAEPEEATSGESQS
jgi:predicted amidohydrolase YtcJ